MLSTQIVLVALRDRAKSLEVFTPSPRVEGWVAVNASHGHARPDPVTHGSSIDDRRHTDAGSRRNSTDALGTPPRFFRPDATP